MVDKAMQNMSLSAYIESLYHNAMNSFHDKLEMHYIHAVSQINKQSNKNLSKDLIESFLKKRGYTLNYIMKKPVMTKGFVVVNIQDEFVEVWHDVPKKQDSVFIKESMLTGLPITLNYMERI